MRGRVEKLLRLAGPSSRAEVHERASAALEVARMYEDGEFTVREARSRHTVRPATGLKWAKSIAARESACAICEGVVERGENVWTRISGFKSEYLHERCQVIAKTENIR